MGKRSELWGCRCCIHVLLGQFHFQSLEIVLPTSECEKKMNTKKLFCILSSVKTTRWQLVPAFEETIQRPYMTQPSVYFYLPCFSIVRRQPDISCSKKILRFSGLFFWLIFLTCQKNVFPINPTTHEHTVMKNTIMLHYGKCGINAAFTCSLNGPISSVGKSLFRLWCVHVCNIRMYQQHGEKQKEVVNPMFTFVRHVSASYNVNSYTNIFFSFLSFSSDLRGH